MLATDITIPSFYNNKKFKDIKNLQPGESGWTYPWAMKQTGERFYLDLDYSLYISEDLRMCLFVKKDINGNIFVNTSYTKGQFWLREVIINLKKYIPVKGFLNCNYV